MIPKEILKKIRQIEIRTKRLVTETLAGQYHSAFKGQGLHFEEVREYAPGDEIRSIDWNVTARMNQPFVKVYSEERELTLMLLMDLSARSKRIPTISSCEIPSSAGISSSDRPK